MSSADDWQTELEVYLLGQAHDMAMSKDPHVAARGRFTKLFAPAFVNWMRDEMIRGEGVEDQAYTLVEGITTMLVGFADQHYQSDGRDRFVAVACKGIISAAKDQGKGIDRAKKKAGRKA